MMRIKTSRVRGLTLIEIVVATTILALVMSSLFVTFRTATKSYDLGITHAEGSQSARFAMTQVTEDLRNVFYKTEKSYNMTRRQREQIQAEKDRQMLQSGSRLSQDDVDEQLPELGPRIDLSFIASDNGETDDMSFVRQQTLKRSEDRKMWGLAKIRYFVAGEKLYRATDDIKAPEVDEEGNEIPKPNPPQIDKIANNVKAFDLKFGYFNENEWKLADNWDSNASIYRNPPNEEEENVDEQVINTVASGDLSSSTELLKPDDLPAWVEITFVMSDPKKEERSKTYKQVVQLLTSQENFEPKDETQDQNSGRWSRQSQGSESGSSQGSVSGSSRRSDSGSQGSENRSRRSQR